jgi:hypothetical protein
MSKNDLRPWSLRPLGTAALAGFVAWEVGKAGLTAYGLRFSDLPLYSKFLTLLFLISVVGAALTLFMWYRSSPGVSLGSIVSRLALGGVPPSPDYADNVEAWHWARWCRAFWWGIIGFGVLSVTVLVVYAR